MKSYSTYDRDRLDAADKMKIERGIYFDTKGADISPLTALPLAELMKLREESAAAEQTVFENLSTGFRMGGTGRKDPAI